LLRRFEFDVAVGFGECINYNTRQFLAARSLLALMTPMTISLNESDSPVTVNQTRQGEFSVDQARSYQSNMRSVKMTSIKDDVNQDDINQR
jgi:hypothetical protein